MRKKKERKMEQKKVRKMDKTLNIQFGNMKFFD